MDLPLPLDLFQCAADLITEDAVIAFVKDAMATRVQAESLVLELKRRNDGDNVIHAVAAMANTDGGIVIVGVDEKLEDPFVGINSAQIDSIVQQMRALIPTAMPEVVPVALSTQEGRAVLVLRVAEGAADRPVVVNGRVSVRAPGATIGARRSEIVAMVNGRGSSPQPPAAYLSMTVGNCTMWPTNAEPQVEVRVHAMLWLPRHLAGLTYLGSDALAAAREALHAGPVPRALVTDHHRSHELRPAFWDFTETRALMAEFHVDAHTTSFPQRPGFEAHARLAVAGRLLELMISTSIEGTNPDEGPVELTIPLLREVLLGGLCSAGAALMDCARAVDPSAPIGPITADAWIGGSSGLSTLKLYSRWTVTGDGQRGPSATWLFDALQPDARSLDSCDDAVRHWLTLLLFGQGVLEFEDDLAAMPKPSWWLEIADELKHAGQRSE